MDQIVFEAIWKLIIYCKFIKFFWEIYLIEESINNNLMSD